MKVTLIDYTGAGRSDPARWAESVLIFAKNTRVRMSPAGLEEINAWPIANRRQEIDYIANTIPGSWEFVAYTFLIEGVGRGFTHQLVRTRTASYAQQTMQVLDMSGFSYVTGPSIAEHPERKKVYDLVMTQIDDAYRWLVGDGAKIEDARGLLPTNVETNILVSMNLRTLVGIVQTRLSPRNAGEYREVAGEMRRKVLEVHPFAEVFLDSDADQAAAELDELISGGEMPPERANRMHKLVDRLRRRAG